MIKHIVMWKLKEENRTQNAKELKMKLLSLVGVVPEIIDMEVGIDVNKSDFHVVLIATFRSLADLNNYQLHYNHLRVSEFCKGIRVERSVVDYEF